jgi:predicted nucleic acid-binding protein
MRLLVSEGYVLDSFALIAHLEGEKRGEAVTQLLKKGLAGKIGLFMSAVNLGEVYYITARERGLDLADQTLLLVGQLPIKIIGVDREMALDAARLKAKYPIAYADCFAAALAGKMKVSVVTGDPEFKRLEKGIKVFWI